MKLIASILLCLCSVGFANVQVEKEQSAIEDRSVIVESTLSAFLGMPSLGLHKAIGPNETVGIYGYMIPNLINQGSLIYRSFKSGVYQDSMYFESDLTYTTVEVSEIKISDRNDEVFELGKPKEIHKNLSIALSAGHQWHWDSGFQTRFSLGGRFGGLNTSSRTLGLTGSLTFGVAI